MEKSKVLVDFKTPTRKFSTGDLVGPGDIDGALSFEARQELGHIEKLAPVAAKPTKSKD